MRVHCVLVLCPLVALTIGLSVGCNHIHVEVPGTLDLRTDASGAPVSKTPLEPTATRRGIDAVFSGEGATIVSTSSGRVEVVDRSLHAFELIAVINTSATQELADAQGDGALREVMIGDQMAIIDALSHFVPVVSSIAGILAPWTFTASGVRVQIPPSPAETPTPPPTGLEPPPALQ